MERDSTFLQNHLTKKRQFGIDQPADDNVVQTKALWRETLHFYKFKDDLTKRHFKSYITPAYGAVCHWFL